MTSLLHWDTTLPADVVQQCPSNEEILACGTYLLDKDAGTKTGKVHFLRAHLGDSTSLQLLQSVETAAVFDFKWLPPSAADAVGALCAWVTSENRLELWRAAGGGELNAQAEGGCAQAAFSVSMELSEKLPGASDASALSLCWLAAQEEIVSPSLQSRTRLAVSSSDGQISVYSLTVPNGVAPAASICLENNWLAHSYGSGSGAAPAEVWTVNAPTCGWLGFAGSGGECHMLWSGGDDALLKVWDLRSLPRPQHVCRQHEAGVCSVEFHPSQPFVVATGSYDERIRVGTLRTSLEWFATFRNHHLACLQIWDFRQMRSPIATAGAGGGVWRLKWLPSATASRHADGALIISTKEESLGYCRLLAACMYGGVRLFDAKKAVPDTAAEAAPWSLVESFHYGGHSSIAYGIEWLPDKVVKAAAGRCGGVVASCSFYDHTLHLWRPAAADVPHDDCSLAVATAAMAAAISP